MTIGNRIKARRVQLGLSQRELSDRMGYSNHSTIARIESGKVDLPQSRILRFAAVLGVSVPYLMGWDENGLMDAYTGLNRHQRKKVMDLIKELKEG